MDSLGVEDEGSQCNASDVALELENFIGDILQDVGGNRDEFSVLAPLAQNFVCGKVQEVEDGKFLPSLLPCHVAARVVAQVIIEAGVATLAAVKHRTVD